MIAVQIARSSKLPQDAQSRAREWHGAPLDAPPTVAERGPSASPVPSSAGVELHFVLPSAQRVRLAIYDVGGRAVDVLENAVLPAGAHARQWSGFGAGGGAVPAGMYVAKLDAGTLSFTRNLVITR